MPGTIQVSVMDFQGPVSASTPAVLLKVSLGKREYQTSDKGDFSFPLTNFRDNLVLKLLDAEGNETARTGIQTMSIVQKVSWDEFFFFDGGGYVHLKLQFILNDEERTRIRLKREAAVKKKQENIPKVRENSDIAPSTGDSVTSFSQAEREESGSLDSVTPLASLLPNADISPADPPRPNYGREGSTLEERSPKSADEREGSFSSPTTQGAEVHFLESDQNVNKLETDQSSQLPIVINADQVKEDSARLLYSGSYAAETSGSSFVGKDDDHVDKSEPVVLERSPSNVRKLATVFESSLAKDSKPSVKVAAVRSETKKVGKQGQYPKDSAPVHFSESAKRSSGRHKDPFFEGNLSTAPETSTERAGEGTDSPKSSTVDNITNETMKTPEMLITAPIRSVENETDTRVGAELQLPAQLERSSTTEKPTISGRMLAELSEGGYSFSLSAEKQNPGGTLFAEAGKGRTDSTKIDIQVASIEKSKPFECYEEELLYSESSGVWIFPNNMKHLCVTAAGKGVMNLVGSGPPETKSPQKKKSSLSSGEGGKEFTHHASENKGQKDQDGSRSIKDSSSGSLPDNAPCGLFGQVIKIAIIAGFGVLVLITRQREPRKSKREANELLLATSGFMDEQSTGEE